MEVAPNKCARATKYRKVTHGAVQLRKVTRRGGQDDAQTGEYMLCGTRSPPRLLSTQRHLAAEDNYT